MNTVEQRLNRLERENQRLKLGGVLLAASLVAAVAFAYFQSPVAEAEAIPERIVAHGFTLVNHQGEIVATLDLLDDGRPSLTLYTASSPERPGPQSVAMILGPGEDAHGGGALIGVGSTRDGGGILLRTYENGRMPFVQIYNPRGQAVWSAP
jgi:hypothetical protein